MPATPPRFSIADVWDETSAFVRREAGLLMPLAFATTGVSALLWDLAVPAPLQGMRPQPGLWLLVLIPVTLLLLIGNIATAALVLHGGISVREALRTAIERIGNAVLLLLLFTAVAAGATVIVTLIALAAGAAVGWGAQQATTLAVLLLLPVLLFLGIRLLTLWPVIAVSPATPAPIRVLKRAYGTTRGVFGRLALAALLYGLAYLVLLTAIQFGLGSVLLLIGRATGQAEAAGLVIAILTALAGAAVQAVWGVYAAIAYRRLSADSSGIA
ncbi:MAG TPA: hypothetical protein VF649_08165 [Sphingomonas sp.]|jgi:hypothetical protein|uniref:hypothetical protein n=1 Tax=Sphingomonas sp. TaxID=28214 RepID=UPI002EDA0B81